MKDEPYTRIMLRIPKELNAQLDRASKLANKSKNAEIIARLEKSFSSISTAERDQINASLQETEKLLENATLSILDLLYIPEKER